MSDEKVRPVGQREFGKLVMTTFSTPAGAKVLDGMAKFTLEMPAFKAMPGDAPRDEALRAAWHDGRCSIVRWINREIYLASIGE